MSVLSRLNVLVGADISGAMGGLTQVDNRIDGFATRAGVQLGKVGTGITAGVTVPLTAAGIAASRASIEIESAFTGVEKTVNGTEAELAALRGELLELATMDSPVAALRGAPLEIMEIAEAAGQLGVAREDVDEFAETMAALGMATDIAGAEGAQEVAQFGSMVDLDGEGYRLIGDVISTLGNNAATTESQILSYGHRLGTLADQNFEADQLLAYGSAMASLGISAELGGTNFTKGVTNIRIAAAQGGPELAMLADMTGLTADEFAALADTDPSAAVRQFVGALDGMSTVEQVAALESLGLGGQEAQRVFLSLAGNVGKLDEQLALAGDAFEGNGALMAEAGKRAETTAGKINILRNNLFVAATLGGDVLNESLNGLLDIVIPMSQQLSTLDPEIVRLGIAVGVAAASAGPLITALGAITFAVGAIGAPIALAIVGISLLSSAWAMNVFGMRDATLVAVREIRGLLDNIFARPVQQGDGVLTGAIAAQGGDAQSVIGALVQNRIITPLRDALRGLSGVQMPQIYFDMGELINPNFAGVADRARVRLSGALASGLSSGAALTSITIPVGGAIVPDFSGLADRVNVGVDDAIKIGLGLAALTFGGPVAAVIGLVNILGVAINRDFLGLRTAMQNAGLPTTIQGAISGVRTWLKTAISGLSFSGVGMSWNFGTLSFGGLVTGIKTKIEAIDWAGGIQGAVNFAGTLMKELAAGINSITGEQVAGALTTGLDVVKTGVVGAFKVWWGAVSLQIDFLSWIGREVIFPLAGAFMTADYSALGIGAWMLMQSLWTKFTQAMPVIGTWVMTNVITPLGNKLTELAGAAAANVTEFGPSLFQGLLDSLPDVAEWVGTNIIEPAGAALAGLVTTVKSNINDAIPNSFPFSWPGLPTGAPQPNFLNVPARIGGGSFEIGPIPDPFPSLDVGGYIAADGLAMVHAGERVLTPAETRDYDTGRAAGGGGGGVTNHYHITSYGTSPAELLDMIRREASMRAPG